MVSDFSCDLFKSFIVCKFLMEGPLEKRLLPKGYPPKKIQI